MFCVFFMKVNHVGAFPGWGTTELIEELTAFD